LSSKRNKEWASADEKVQFAGVASVPVRERKEGARVGSGERGQTGASREVTVEVGARRSTDEAGEPTRGDPLEERACRVSDRTEER